MKRVVILMAGLLIALPALAQKKGAEKPDFTFQPETVEKSGPASKTLEKALKLYETNDFYSASIELHKVIEGETGDGEANKQRAEFWMGKTLYHLHFYSASLSYFDRIVQKGDSHRYYNATLKWLASLSRQLPESAGILKKIGKYDKAQLEQPALEKVRDELFYLLGRFHYSQSNFKDAAGLFATVPTNSPFYARAKFMEGITYVRSYQARPAAEAFKTLLRVARESPATNEIREFEELAVLSLARVFYSTGQYELSIKYYDQIVQESPNWLDSLFESSWAHFQRNNFSKALGNIHTLNAPYFDTQFFPESMILKAVIYFQHCLYDRSAEAIRDFNAKYPPLGQQVNAILKQYKDPGELYEYSLKIKAGTSGLNEDVARITKGALGDRTIQKYFSYVDELDRELKQVQAADPAWKATAIAGVVLQDLTLQKSLAQNEAGQLAGRRLARVIQEIRELEKQAIKVEYETINGQKDKLEASLRNEQAVQANAVTGGDITPDDEHYFWPFDGEYWKDELGYYRFKIQNRCGR
jgi:TolA-binding protein